MTDISKISTPRGEARSIAPLSPTRVDVRYNDGAAWMGPGVPPAPLAPPEVAGRSWDYPFGINQSTTPRALESISFETLRTLAASYDPLRLVIERRKDQLCRLPWKIRPRHDGLGPHPSAAKVSPEMRSRIDDVTQLFRRPSYGNTFRTFLRQYLEDLFVIDAGSIFLQRDRAGHLIGLRNIDGATLKPVIDEWGNVPEPALTASQLPEHFHRLGYREHNGIAWPTLSQQNLKGLPAVNYTGLDLIARPYNPTGRGYGLSPVEQIAMTVSIALRRTQSQLDYYREGNVPAGIFNLPETWSVDQVSQFQAWWDSLFLGDIGRRRQMRFVSGNGKYQPFAEPPLKTEVDDWLARIVCFAFSYPPAALVSLQNRSIAEQHERTAEEEGVEPLKQHLAEIFGEIIEVHLGHDDLEFSFVEETEVDQEKQSKILTKYCESGILTINQVLEKLGEEPSADPAASRNMVRTATGYVAISQSDDVVADDGDTEKLAKGPITLLAPSGWKPVARFSRGGTTFIPNLAKRQLLVFSEVEAIILESEGWKRSP